MNISRIGMLLLALVGCGLAPNENVTAAPLSFHGHPPIRSYPIEDIGPVTRGANLTFDAFGRIAVVQEGAFAALNDTVWVHLADSESLQPPVMIDVAYGADGQAYYGGRGDFGIAELGGAGRYRTQSLLPDALPKWVETAIFADVICATDGVYFPSWNGVAFYDFATRETSLYDTGLVSLIFAIDDTVYVSAKSKPLRRIDAQAQSIVEVSEATRQPPPFEHAARFSEGQALLSDLSGELWVFDGETLTRWEGQARWNLVGRVSSLQGLATGGVAVAITGRGLYLIDADGELTASLTTAEFQRVTELANREPGVLWVATEDSIEKVSYGSGLTSFGQRLGISLGWPIVERWRGRLFAASNGELFEGIKGSSGAPDRFVSFADQPHGGAWSIDSNAHALLVGSPDGVYSLNASDRFDKVLDFSEVLAIQMIGADTCLVIGRFEIAALEWRDGAWSERMQRIPGLEYAPVVHASDRSVWVELGGGGVARIWIQDGVLRRMEIENATWTSSSWVNVGIVDNIAILGASMGNRRFYDEQANAWVDAQWLDQLLNRSPHWISRAKKDSDGVIWATHNEGVVTFTPTGNDYAMDSASYDQINDRYPRVNIIEGNDVWINAGHSLYHVEKRGSTVQSEVLQPVIVSLLDTKSNRELLTDPTARRDEPMEFSYQQNSLSFQIFAGGYGWRRAPVYEFKIDDQADWTVLDSGSRLTFSGLREGLYDLRLRLSAPRPTNANIIRFQFKVRPPWHRTRVALASYGLLGALVVAGGLRWSNQLVRKRNRMLESLVDERTRELKSATERLNEETRNAATLAERNRLAGEIHDSLQQGLSGAMFQLDSTLKLPLVAGEVRSRLTVIRNMVSFTRQEVQHLVWDMESPLLEGTELSDALRRLTGYINTESAAVEVEVEGDPIPLPNAVKHNLLRIAQEATTNAERHAHASQIAIRLTYSFESVTLRIKDDGIGFDPESVLVAKIGHFGLRGIRSRARKLGAELTIESAPGEGAEISIIVPTRQSAAAHAHAGSSKH